MIRSIWGIGLFIYDTTYETLLKDSKLKLTPYPPPPKHHPPPSDFATVGAVVRWPSELLLDEATGAPPKVSRAAGASGMRSRAGAVENTTRVARISLEMCYPGRGFEMLVRRSCEKSPKFCRSCRSLSEKSPKLQGRDSTNMINKQFLFCPSIKSY
ncbi:hypothetical protein LIER_26987 [Lithospermum erythrorhizon]|uniref:Uncharacterized protein n=1 Tax=Lithospermum erythrorhizon TaxID=34254 RepID=A0AAV3RDE5_LITER